MSQPVGAPPRGAETPERSSRGMVAVLGIGGLLVAALVVLTQREGDGGSTPKTPEDVARAYIDGWNDRDAAAVSSLTCTWIPAFTPVSVVESQFAASSAGRVVGEYSLTGTDPATAYGRDVVAVHVQYVPGRGGRSREDDVLVDTNRGPPCVAYLTTW